MVLASCPAMGTPSLEDLKYKYDRLRRLVEEGRSCRSPLPAATAAPSQSQFSSPPPPPLPQEGGAPCTTSEPSRRIPAAWPAGVIRGFSITFWLVILVLLVAPMAMQSTDKEDVFYCVGIFLLSFAFPLMGYGVTWDEPGWL